MTACLARMGLVFSFFFVGTLFLGPSFLLVGAVVFGRRLVRIWFFPRFGLFQSAEMLLFKSLAYSGSILTVW